MNLTSNSWSKILCELFVPVCKIEVNPVVKLNIGIPLSTNSLLSVQILWVHCCTNVSCSLFQWVLIHTHSSLLTPNGPSYLVLFFYVFFILINCSFYFLLHVYLGRKFTNSALYDFFMTYTFLFRSSNLLKTWAYLRVYWKVQSCVFLLILRKSEQWFSKHFASSFFNSKYLYLSFAFSLHPFSLFPPPSHSS